MSVFLRWGVFGILAVAALLYAFNANKRLAERRTGAPAVVTAPQERGDDSESEEGDPDETPAADPGGQAMPRHCEAELVVARRALEARRTGEPLDRLLRIQEIAFEEGERRARLQQVATHWYERPGDAPGPEALRIYVATDCESFSPAP